jgi:hypothetical protein
MIWQDGVVTKVTAMGRETLIWKERMNKRKRRSKEESGNRKKETPNERKTKIEAGNQANE